MFADLTRAGCPLGPLDQPRPLWRELAGGEPTYHYDDQCAPASTRIVVSLASLDDGHLCDDCEDIARNREGRYLTHARLLVELKEFAEHTLTVTDCLPQAGMPATSLHSLLTARGWPAQHPRRDASAPELDELHTWGTTVVAPVVEAAVAHVTTLAPARARDDWRERWVVAESALGRHGSPLPLHLVPNRDDLATLMAGRDATQPRSFDPRRDHSVNQGPESIPAQVRGYAVQVYTDGATAEETAAACRDLGARLLAKLPPLADGVMPPLHPDRPVPAGDFTTLGELADAAWMAAASGEIDGLCHRIGAALTNREADVAAEGLRVVAFEPTTPMREYSPLLYAYATDRLPDGSILAVLPPRAIPVIVEPRGGFTRWTDFGAPSEGDTVDLYADAAKVTGGHDDAVEVTAALRAAAS